MERYFKYLSLGTSLLLLTLTVVFYMQRVIMYDSSFYLFNMLEEKCFCIQHNRYAAIVSQLLPWVFIKMALPLKWVAVAFSVNLGLVAITLSLISGYWLKNWRAAAAIIIAPFLFNSEMLFWMVAEAQYLPLYWLFIYAFIDYCFGKNVNVGRTVLLLILLFLGFTIHPLSIFCFFALFLFLILTKRYTEPVFFLTLLFSVLVFLLKSKMVSYSSYDKGAMDRVSNIVTLFPHYFNIPSNTLFVSLLWNKMFMIPLVFLISIYFFLKHKQYFAVLLFIGLVLGFLLFTNLCFYDIREFEKLYLENLYQPLVFMLLAPLVFLLKRRVKGTMLLFVFLLSILLGGVRTIQSSTHYTQRLNWERAFIKANEDKKLVIHSSYVPMELLGQPWCTAFEFALLSAMENKRTTSHLVTFDAHEVPTERIVEHKGMVHQNGWIPFSKLDKHYFNFTDTTNSYIRVSPW